MRQGWKGHLAELMLLYFTAWGFPLEDIRTDVYLWHGEADKNAVVEHGRYLAAHIPNCKATFLPGVGHFITDPHWDAIFGVFKAS